MKLKTNLALHELHRYYLVFAAPPATGSRLREAPARAAHLFQRDRWRWSPRRLGRRVDEIPIRAPIFVLGTQGGGLTLLARTLKRHPVVVTIGGDSRHWTNHDELAHQLSRMRRLPRSLWGPKFRYDLDHPLYGIWHNSAYASDVLLPHYRRTASDATGEEAAVLKRMIREHLAVHARDLARARFLDKSQTTTVRVAYVDALLRGCDPHFVLVARSPYTMSWRSARKQLPSLKAPLSDEEKLRLVSQHWANAYARAFGDAEHVERFIVVRFEDFLADPEAVVRRICAFAGLEFDRDMLPQPHHRLPRDTFPGDDKWYPLRDDPYLDQLSEKEIAIVDERCKPLADRLGYTPQGTLEIDPEAVRATRGRGTAKLE